MPEITFQSDTDMYPSLWMCRGRWGGYSLFSRESGSRFRDSDLLHSLKKFNFLVTMKGGMN